MSDVAASAAADVRRAWRGLRAPDGSPTSTCTGCRGAIVLGRGGWAHRAPGDARTTHPPHDPCPPAGLGEDRRKER